MIQCPSCGRRQGPRLICENCGAPLGAEVDGFAAFSLPRKLVLDTSALERIYHDLSRQIHPDRFAQGSAQLRDASLRSTALLTRKPLHFHQQFRDALFVAGSRASIACGENAWRAPKRRHH